MNNSKIDIQKNLILENLICPICLEYLEEPVMELPNRHLFCRKCIFQWLWISNDCPLCKVNIINIVESLLAKVILSTIPSKCPNQLFEINLSEKKCNWQGDLLSLSFHKKHCEVAKINDKKKLEDAIIKMKKILDREINPHLINFHKSIFDKYVKGWEWLSSDGRDWKWWWWADNEWWEDKSCPECNILWHRYEEEILVHETIRRNIIFQHICI